MRVVARLVGVLVVGCVLSGARGQPASSAPAPTSAPSGGLLGAAFESPAAGIAFRAPAGAREIRRGISDDEVVRYVNDERKWVLKVTRIILSKPLPLMEWQDPKAGRQPGMLEFIAEQFKTDTPGAEILRQDVVNIGDAQVGMIAARFTFGLETNLTQQAIIHASNYQYYVLAMTCPAPRTGDVSADPQVQLAVETFSQVLDTVKLLDQTALTQDFRERLLRTRLLYANLTEPKLRQALQHEQWVRLIREGKDIGYTYIVEEVARDLPRRGRDSQQETGPEGVLIGVRSRTVPETGVQVDAESWLFCTFDRKYEGWSNIAFVNDSKHGKSTTGELAVSRRRQRPVKDAGLGMQTDNNTGVSLVDEYRLEVSKIGKNQTGEPQVVDLPPYYLPQALGQLLPRLVPLGEPRTYAFATWVSDIRKLAVRYVDVGAEQEVNLAGKRLRAIPVKDRVGLEGSLTIHYLSPEGKFLGSVNEEAGITMLPSDPATIEKLWQNANLTRPGAVEGN